MVCTLMTLLIFAFHELAPAHAAPPAPVPELAPLVETAPPAVLSNSIFQHLAASAASQRSGATIGIQSAGEEASAPAEEESALSPRSSLLPAPRPHGSLPFTHCAAACPSTLPVNDPQLAPTAIDTAAMQRQGAPLASHHRALAPSCGQHCCLPSHQQATNQAAAATSTSRLKPHPD